jgi:hypothetical protein
MRGSYQRSRGKEGRPGQGIGSERRRERWCNNEFPCIYTLQTHTERQTLRQSYTDALKDTHIRFRQAHVLRACTHNLN